MSADIAAVSIDKLREEIKALRNEIARLGNQTNWVCKCGGTDTKGQRENAALRADRNRLDWLDFTTEGINWQSQNTNRITRDAIDAAMEKGAAVSTSKLTATGKQLPARHRTERELIDQHDNAIMRILDLERENLRLQMELNGLCNAEELGR